MLEQANAVREKHGLSSDARNQRDRLRHRYLAEAADVDKMMERFSFETPIRDLDKGRLPRHIAEQQFDKVWPLSDIWRAEEQRRQANGSA
jgi:hypothetical protein